MPSGVADARAGSRGQRPAARVAARARRVRRSRTCSRWTRGGRARYITTTSVKVKTERCHHAPGRPLKEFLEAVSRSRPASFRAVDQIGGWHAIRVWDHCARATRRLDAKRCAGRGHTKKQADAVSARLTDIRHAIGHAGPDADEKLSLVADRRVSQSLMKGAARLGAPEAVRDQMIPFTRVSPRSSDTVGAGLAVVDNGECIDYVSRDRPVRGQVCRRTRTSIDALLPTAKLRRAAVRVEIATGVGSRAPDVSAMSRGRGHTRRGRGKLEANLAGPEPRVSRRSGQRDPVWMPRRASG